MPTPVIGKKTQTATDDMPAHVYGACGTGLTTELRIVEW